MHGGNLEVTGLDCKDMTYAPVCKVQRPLKMTAREMEIHKWLQLQKLAMFTMQCTCPKWVHPCGLAFANCGAVHGDPSKEIQIILNSSEDTNETR